MRLPPSPRSGRPCFRQAGPSRAGRAPRRDGRSRLSPWMSCSRSLRRSSRCGSPACCCAPGTTPGPAACSRSRRPPRRWPGAPPTAGTTASFRVWYLAGALLSAPLLGVGSLIALGPPLGGAARPLYTGLAVGVAAAMPVHGTFASTSVPHAQDHVDALPRVVAIAGSSLGTLAVVLVAVATMRASPRQRAARRRRRSRGGRLRADADRGRGRRSLLRARRGAALREREPARRFAARRFAGQLLRRTSAAELRAHALVHDARVGLAAGLLHHLADEEAEQALLAAAELLRLARVRLDDPVDDRVELARVARRPSARDTAPPRSLRRRPWRAPRRTSRAGSRRARRRAARAPPRSPRPLRCRSRRTGWRARSPLPSRRRRPRRAPTRAGRDRRSPARRRRRTTACRRCGGSARRAARRSRPRSRSTSSAGGCTGTRSGSGK